jgi:hypothetical protein
VATGVTASLFWASTTSAQTTRASEGTGAVQANQASSGPAVSADGRYVAFTSAATNLTVEASPGTFLRDRQAATTTLISSARQTPDLSRTGRYLLHAIEQPAPEPVRWAVRDRQAGTTTDVPPIGGPGVVSHVVAPTLALDGRHVAYYSDREVPPGAVFGAFYRGIFVYDLDAATACSAHQASDGTPGNALYAVDGLLPPGIAVSPDGRYVAYQSQSTNLVAGDTNGVPDVFLHDCSTGETSRASVGAGVQANAASSAPAVSADGRYVAFHSLATNLTLEALPGYFVHDRLVGQTVRLPMPGRPPYTSDLATAISEDGRFITAATEDPVGQVHVVQYDRATATLVQVDVTGLATPGNGNVSPVDIDVGPDGRFVAFASLATNLVASDTNAVGDVFLRDVFDPDGDSMTSEWEAFFGFNPTDPADGATDADGDTRTNAQEFADGTHPRGLASATRYFAEGAASEFFATRVSVANPSATDTAHVLLRYERANGAFSTSLVRVPPMQARRVRVDQIVAMLNSEFATVVESDVPVVADRHMFWTRGDAYGSHAERAIVAPAAEWHLAEGSTVGDFNLFYLFQNPGASVAQVEVRYLLPAGPPVVRAYNVQPRSRFNVWVNTVPGLASTDVSAVVRVLSGPDIIVERAMYLSRPGQAFAAGHEGAGVTAPALEWTFAEGATGPFFDLFVLAANSNGSAAGIEATYLLPDGSTLVKNYNVPANSRFNIWVDEESFGGVKALANTSVSVALRSTNGVSFVAERAMWWPGASDQWYEAHDSAGATATAPRWGVADGEVGLAPGNAETYLLIANRSTFAGSIRVTLLYTDGGPAESRTFNVSASSRFNVDVRSQFPAALGRSFGAIVESLGAMPAALVVERALYNDAGGVRWAAGANALATAF